MVIKIADLLYQKHFVGELLQRPSETIELNLYFFILAYLMIFDRRISEIETDGTSVTTKA
jgi:hypothetical protein